MTRNKQHRIIGVERLLGAVPVVDIDINDGDARQTVLGL